MVCQRAAVGVDDVYLVLVRLTKEVIALMR